MPQEPKALPVDPAPVKCGDLARALARPGRFEVVDESKAYRVLYDIVKSYSRGKFREDEVLFAVELRLNGAGKYVLAPINDAARWQPLVTVGRQAESLGMRLVLEAHREWRDDIALRAPAVRAYLEGCGLASAERVLREMFGAAGAAQRSRRQSGKKERPDSATLDAWMLENVKPSAKRDPTISDCRNATGATWREAIAAWQRLPEDRRLKRGQKSKSSK